MKISLKLYISSLFAVGIAAFLLGHFLTNKSSVDRSSSENSQFQEKMKAIAKTPEKINKPSTETPTNEIQADGKSESDDILEPDIFAQIDSAVKIRDLRSRSMAFAMALRGLNEDNLSEVLDRVMRIENVKIQRDAFYPLFSNWARFDPEGAAEYALSFEGNLRKSALSASLRRFGEGNPNLALSWIDNNLPDAEERSSGITEVLFEWVENDFQGASEYVLGLDNLALREKGIVILNGIQLTHIGSGQAASWVQSLPDDDPTIKQTAITTLAKIWASNDPQSAFEWVITPENNVFNPTAIQDVSRFWASRNPADAVSRVESLPEGPVRVNALTGLVEGWAKTEPNAAGGWLNEHLGEPGINPVMGAFAKEIATVDPQSALIWSDAITDPSVQRATQIAVAQKWNLQDPDAVRIWLDQNDFTADEAQSVLTFSEERKMLQNENMNAGMIGFGGKYFYDFSVYPEGE